LLHVSTFKGPSSGTETKVFIIILFPNGRYIYCLTLTYATNKGEILKLRYKYYIEKRINIKNKINIQNKYKIPNNKG